jgi:hypothetical protein
MLRRVALVRTNASEERSASIIGVTKIGELGTLTVTNLRAFETSRLIRATRRDIPD